MNGQARPCGLAERCVGWIILLVLAIIATGVFVKQSRYDRAMFAAAGPLARAAASSPPPASTDAGFLELPGELTPLSPPETFTPDNLYDKIDGKAELYTSAGFVGMRCQRLALKSDSNAWFEFFVYDMENLRQAFAVYSMQQRADAQPLDFATYAYETKNALFLCCGRYYIEAVSASSSGPMMAAMLSVSKLFIAKNPPQGTRVPELDLFHLSIECPTATCINPRMHSGSTSLRTSSAHSTRSMARM